MDEQNTEVTARGGGYIEVDECRRARVPHPWVESGNELRLNVKDRYVRVAVQCAIA